MADPQAYWQVFRESFTTAEPAIPAVQVAIYVAVVTLLTLFRRCRACLMLRQEGFLDHGSLRDSALIAGGVVLFLLLAIAISFFGHDEG